MNAAVLPAMAVRRYSLVLHELQEQTTLDDNLVARRETGDGFVLIPDAAAQGNPTPRETVIRGCQINEGEIFVVAQDRGRRHQQPGLLAARMDQNTDVHLLLQNAFWILRDDADADGARVGINYGGNVIDGAEQICG